jgi:hypothetical protein
MHVRRLESRQLRNPTPDVVARGVELLALRLRIEDAEIRRRVGAAARDPLPVQGVRREIRVDQRVPEPARAREPVNAQVLHEKRCDDHAHAVVHPARSPQLPHPGVHDRKAGVTALPCSQVRSIGGPLEALEASVERLQRRVRKVIDQMMCELAPQQL